MTDQESKALSEALANLTHESLDANMRRLRLSDPEAWKRFVEAPIECAKFSTYENSVDKKI